MPAADQYLRAQVLTASPYRLHLMVIEGAVRYTQRAAEAMESGEYDAAFSALSKSRDFVTELIGGIRDEFDAELAGRMKQLFLFAYVNLAEAERDRNPQKVRDALGVLMSHHETWRELGEKLLPAAPEETLATKEAEPKTVGQSRAWSA